MAPSALLLRITTLLFFIFVVFASPFETRNTQDSTSNFLLNLTQDNELHNRAAKDFYLRVMPLGASITMGGGSSDGNGFRKKIRDQLRYDMKDFSSVLSHHLNGSNLPPEITW